MDEGVKMWEILKLSIVKLVVHRFKFSTDLFDLVGMPCKVVEVED